MRRWQQLIATAIAGTALFLGAAPALAGSFHIEPTRLELDGRRATSLFTITNTSDAPVRFQVTARAWSQDRSGAMVLAETRDLVVYPSLFELPAGKSRSIRIGTTARPGAVERTYRVFVQELPPLARRGSGQQIRVLTRIGIPVFLAPGAERAAGAISAVSIAPARVSVTVANRGNKHFRVRSVRVIGRDVDGAAVFDRQVPGWYVLAGNSRRFDLPLDSGDAARVHSISATAESDHGTWTYAHEKP